MAIKDWKQRNNYTWTKKNNEIQIIEDRTKDASKIGGYIIQVYEFDRDNYFEKSFKSKSQALSFANKYMASH